MNNMFRFALVGGLALNFGCKAADDTEAEICDNADVDDDGDGDADCDDSDCATDDACVEVDEDCDNGRDDDGDGDEDCDDSECRSDAACEEIEFFEPYAFTIEGQFGFDGENVVPGVGSDGEPIPISVEITIGDEALWTTGNGDECVYVLVTGSTVTSLPLTTWPAVDGAVQGGFILPTDSSTMDTNCNDLAFDPEVWGPSFDDLVTSFNWGVSIGETTASVEKAIADAVKSGDLTEEDVPSFLGAGMYFELIGGGEDDRALNAAHYGFGYEVDENMILSVNDAEENINLVYENVATGTGIPPRGFYVTASLGGFYATVFERAIQN